MLDCVAFTLQGMVEKWLLEVESLMLKSIRHVIYQGMIQYAEVSVNITLSCMFNSSCVVSW